MTKHDLIEHVLTELYMEYLVHMQLDRKKQLELRNRLTLHNSQLFQNLNNELRSELEK